MNQPPAASRAAFVEFVILMALLTSLIALSIDAMLPVLPQIGETLAVAEPNHNQYVITVFFFGFAIGQLFYGPISDSTGRKPAIYVGLFLFAVGALISMTATNFAMMLFGRALQGIGAAGPRTVSLAMVRDQYEGAAMARVMSFVMAVFILVPVIAPSLGQGIYLLAGWRTIYATFIILALIGFLLLWLRQAETLAVEHRLPLSLGRITGAMIEALTNRTAFIYILTSGLIFGGFIGYLASSQQIFTAYGQEALFPLFFASLAIAIGISSIINTKLVMRFGMRPLSIFALAAIAVLSVIFLLAGIPYGGLPPLVLFMAYAGLVFFGIGILIANLMALAMEPLGHIAGAGAAVVGFLSTFIALALGTVIGQSFNGTPMPLAAGFSLLGLISVAVIIYGSRAERAA
ncbi:MAG: multidrug effflux MFS transporter [Pseudomonadota bacterium]